jgi:quercetin dioxygenase-like cupin family protein
MKTIKAEYERTNERGSLIQVSTGEWKQVNVLKMNKGKTFGGHYHKKRTELFYVIQGELSMPDRKLHSGEAILIEPFDMHTFTACEDSIVLELLSTPFTEEDTHT